MPETDNILTMQLSVPDLPYEAHSQLEQWKKRGKWLRWCDFINDLVKEKKKEIEEWIREKEKETDGS